VPLSAKRCRKILTISEYSKQEIINYLRVSSHKVVVTPLALDLELPGIATESSEQQIGQTCRKHGIPQPYVLSVGGVGMHKNPIALLKALKVLRSRPRAGNLTLVIVGRDYGARAEIESRASSLGIRGSVHLPGYVPRQDLPALYAGSLVYVSPSYFEGFGLTVLEAMAFKCPVVVSNRTALPEVAGHAALIVDPDDTEGLADAILLAAFDPEYRTRMIEAGTRRIKDFSWDRAARLTLTAYEEAAAGYA
jgi:glycosyltransferase involved in cell wall biosynthesis